MEASPLLLEPLNEHPHAESLIEVNEPEDVIQNKRKSSESPDYDRSPEKKAKSASENASSRTGHPRDERSVYGNPKDALKPSTPAELFDTNSVLDLSFKGSKPDVPKSKPSEITYQNHPRNNHPYLPDPFPRSNLEIKLVNAAKRPSTTEQLQIAKLQQQQRRSVQQQQKLLQQMRRSLDAAGSRQLPGGEPHKKPSSREEPPEPAPKDEFHPSMMAPSSFPPHPYYDPSHSKELPDGHPILPLLDPVYFSALYNAHGFMPPSSPSIAAAFIGTLQDALPKLSMMFPPTTSSSGTSLLPHKTNENPN